MLGTDYDGAEINFYLWAHNNVSDLNNKVALTSRTHTQGEQKALGLSVAPDGNKMALKRVMISSLPSGLTTSET